ncbi:1-phosphofructokinase family hexose kinase [Streptomyces rapamycinicus]|uniref:Sugar kinase n=2 Tax=Streptomyces rapamycinicus TaxID=1226757 RepID=A0A0A0NIK1_STRRN|nr:1-phosphofructokinase family hexose kinase [Streptomyces rapamycinicus]AGP57026.1 sugar kinase [Streptomyces rapamycinicus NRRL 5491]MBB4784657.1 tagatose 6-phosphate kinase [Streptomyces rapamycinicus]RLV79864.1 sugar kinase [Streptomyces rapamycinicus NRRL 5491]UTO64938.1 1-phosphofructokinase family hexose kinase [Streptomyces rapamycinicus]UTP32894.1 1-phosphofructokinase family hexose kinase [Streptomyces rapamycinicus NRRL 5491]
MILTVTLNTALDVTYRVPELRPHTTHRVTEVTERPGGKGLNVARVLAALGHDTVVTGFVGGVTGAVLRQLLAGIATPGGGHKAPRGTITDALVPIAGTTRRTIGVVDAATGDTTQLNEPGPIVTTPEWSTFMDGYGRLLREASAVALCGSLPPGVPVGTYAQLIREAHAAGVPTLLDTSGEPLRRGIAARPHLVKPNADELAGLTGSTDPLRAARDARRRGARAVAASLGPDGMLMVTAHGAWRANPPRRLTGNPTGAGDAAVAGLLSGLVEEVPWPDRLARAVALSAAAVRAPVAGEFDRAVYDEALARVEVTEHPAAA